MELSTLGDLLGEGLSTWTTGKMKGVRRIRDNMFLLISTIHCGVFLSQTEC